jgi:hypothetical protein
VWFTLEGGELSEVYYPTLDTPSFRDLQFVVDGVNERDGAVHRVVLLDPRSLTYEQTNTDRRHRWRLTKTYVTDPARSSVLVNVRFVSLDGRRHRVSMLADAAPSNQAGAGLRGCSPSGVLASDSQMAIALLTQPRAPFQAASCITQDGIVTTKAFNPPDRPAGSSTADPGACLRPRPGRRAGRRSRLASHRLGGRREPLRARLAPLPQLAPQAAPQPGHPRRTS